jgi:hypothetical protein
VYATLSQGSGLRWSIGRFRKIDHQTLSGVAIQTTGHAEFAMLCAQCGRGLYFRAAFRT